MQEHRHQFQPATLIPFAGGRRVAWVPTLSVSPEESTPHAWMCFEEVDGERCGEQGYEVR